MPQEDVSSISVLRLNNLGALTRSKLERDWPSWPQALLAASSRTSNLAWSRGEEKLQVPPLRFGRDDKGVFVNSYEQQLSVLSHFPPTCHPDPDFLSRCTGQFHVCAFP
jgi:hypothetical protein